MTPVPPPSPAAFSDIRVEGVVGIAAPVLGVRGQFVAALTASVLVLRIAGREIEIAALVKEHAARLTKALAAAGRAAPLRRRRRSAASRAAID